MINKNILVLLVYIGEGIFKKKKYIKKIIG